MNDESPTNRAATTDLSTSGSSSPRRKTWYVVLPLVPLVLAAIGFVVFLNQDSPETSNSADGTTAAVEQLSFDDVSDEQLEDLLDSYRDDPTFADQIPGVTLLLAERYFTVSAYDRAFPLYAEVIENSRTRPKQFALSLSRIAWIGWLSNGDTAAALTNLDRSLSIDPNNAETTYIKAQILWCGAGQTEAAIELFAKVLNAPDLTDDIRTQVYGDLDAARSGATC